MSNYSTKLLHNPEANQGFTGPRLCPAFFKIRIQPGAKGVMPIESAPQCLPFLPLHVSLDTWSRCYTRCHKDLDTWPCGFCLSTSCPQLSSPHINTHGWIYCYSCQIENQTIALRLSRAGYQVMIQRDELWNNNNIACSYLWLFQCLFFISYCSRTVVWFLLYASYIKNAAVYAFLIAFHFGSQTFSIAWLFLNPFTHEIHDFVFKQLNYNRLSYLCFPNARAEFTDGGHCCVLRHNSVSIFINESKLYHQPVLPHFASNTAFSNPSIPSTNGTRVRQQVPQPCHPDVCHISRESNQVQGLILITVNDGEGCFSSKVIQWAIVEKGLCAFPCTDLTDSRYVKSSSVTIFLGGLPTEAGQLRIQSVESRVDARVGSHLL